MSTIKFKQAGSILPIENPKTLAMGNSLKLLLQGLPSKGKAIHFDIAISGKGV